MNLLKPRRTFESVVRELVAGLEEGTIVLKQQALATPSRLQTLEVDLSSVPLGIKVLATPSVPGKTCRFGFVTECVLEMTAGKGELTIDTGPSRGVRISHKSSERPQDS